MKHKKVKTKFLWIPILRCGKIYWLENVKITKNFNGYRFVTTNIEKQ